MKFFKPLPAAGTVIFGSLFCLLAGFTGHYSYAAPTASQSDNNPAPTPTPTPAAQVGIYSSCSQIPAEQEANRTACDKHYKEGVHKLADGIRVIPHNLTQITREVIDGTNSLNNQTLFIFESVTPQDEVVEYDLWSGFKMPPMSTFAGNLDSDELPRLTLTESTDPDFTASFDSVITADSSTGDYWLADLEVDSGGRSLSWGCP